jgi:hypothetical protein
MRKPHEGEERGMRKQNEGRVVGWGSSVREDYRDEEAAWRRKEG